MVDVTDDGTLDDAPVAPRAKAVDRARAGGKRFYQGTEEIDHDLFKLESATMKKNVSYTDVPDYEKIEHVHMFHTVDSNGRKQDASTAVGGHFHLVTVIDQANGVPTLDVSGPMKHVMKRVKGKKTRVAIPLTDEDEDGDTHTHAVTYLKSEKIKRREANAAFASYEAEIAAKQNPSLPGVISA